jgi:hypothetical protein
MEDVVSLAKCETDVCRDILTKEVQLLEHMNVLMSMVQSGRAAEAQDYNSIRSNKPGSVADGVGDGDPDSDDDVIETAKDYNSSRSNKPRSETPDDISDDCDDDGPCPRPDNALYLAKELGLASVGNDIENIKQALDRCDDGVCEQVRLNADIREKGVRRALENPTGMDGEIEEIRSIVREDVESLGKCETDVCREVLAMEEQLLMKMNRLSDIAMVAPAQDYNSVRSNKPGSIAEDIGDDDTDSDGDGIDDLVAPAQDYNSVRSNKPGSIAEDIGGGDGGVLGKAGLMARMANPAGTIISTGSVMMSTNNPLYEGQANDGDSDNNNEDPAPVQRFDLQPSSYCVELGANSQQGRSTEAQDYNAARSNKPTSRSADTGDDEDSDNDGVVDSVETAQDYNSSRSNKPRTIADIGDFDSDGFPDVMKSASFSISKRSARTGRIRSSNGGGDGRVLVAGGYQFNLEIDPLDPDDDGDGVLGL